MISGQHSFPQVNTMSKKSNLFNKIEEKEKINFKKKHENRMKKTKGLTHNKEM